MVIGVGKGERKWQKESGGCLGKARGNEDGEWLGMA